jgi:hypothetical protein
MLMKSELVIQVQAVVEAPESITSKDLQLVLIGSTVKPGSTVNSRAVKPGSTVSTAKPLLVLQYD